MTLVRESLLGVLWAFPRLHKLGFLRYSLHVKKKKKYCHLFIHSCIYLFETGSLYIDQAGLELTEILLPPSGIKGACYLDWLVLPF